MFIQWKKNNTVALETALGPPKETIYHWDKVGIGWLTYWVSLFYLQKFRRKLQQETIAEEKGNKTIKDN